MKTEYKFIEFEKAQEFRSEWNCFNKKTGNALGVVEFYRTWKKWVFCATNGSILFSADCLDDISHFMKQLPKKP